MAHKSLKTANGEIFDLKRRIAELEQENERLREAIRASQNGTICPLCNSMPHNDSCPALNGEMGDDL